MRLSLPLTQLHCATYLATTRELTKATMKPVFQALIGSSLLVLVAPNLSAAECEGKDCVCQPDIIAFPNNTVDGPEGKIPLVLEADNVESDGQKSITLSGKAFVAQGRQSIAGEKLTYDKETSEVQGSGNVTLRSVAGDLVTAESIDLDVNNKIGTARDAKFKLAERGYIEEETNAVEVHSRGKAAEISLEGEDFARLKKVEYTTCVEGQDDFFIRAGELELDQATGMGTAKNASIIFKGVPIFYAPRFTFPINDERKSGFLFPSAGSDSDSGFVFSAPWYWNISPNMDATIFPRLYTDRGVQLGVEVRHESLNSESFFYAETLSNDKEFNDENRSMVTFQHEQDFTERLSAEIDYNDVSDQQYFTDFRSDIRSFSATYIPRNARLDYNARYWNLSGNISEYELVDDTILEENKPFERRPEIKFRSSFPKVGGLQFATTASATNFSHDTKQEGWRYLLEPSVAVPIENVWGYVEPKLAVNHASYDVDNFDADSRTVPIFSIDSGIHLEKRTSFLGEAAIQTLEPRIFSVYVDEDEQENVPIFDTKALTFNNFNSLFSTSGFSGGDRVADGRQVSLSLTSRIFDKKGSQRLKASIGQAYYLEDREVTVNEETQMVSKSDLLAEASLSLGKFWELDGFLQYGTATSDIQTANIDIEYREHSQKFASFGYRFSEVTSSIDQIVIEAEWPLSQKWTIFGAERYGIEESENLQTTLGLEYDACCWRFRVSAHNLRKSNDETRTTILAEFELTGLGTVTSRSGL